MMQEPIFLDGDDVEAMQYQLIETLGGLHGLRHEIFCLA